MKSISLKTEVTAGMSACGKLFSVVPSVRLVCMRCAVTPSVHCRAQTLIFSESMDHDSSKKKGCFEMEQRKQFVWPV